MKTIHTCMACIFIYFIAGHAAEASTKNIAVTTLSAKGISEQEASVLTDVLRSQLSGNGVYQVLERTEMDQVLKEQGFQKTGACDESSCALELGQLLGVDYMAMGTIGLVGNTYSVGVRLVEVRTGKITRDANEFFKGSRDDLMVKVIPSIARKLCDLKTAPRGDRNKKKWIAGITSTCLIALAVPVAMFLTRDDRDEDEDNTEVRVKWNQ